jgi:hypothetical protein
MKRFFSLALAVGIWAIYPTTSFSQSSQIGVTDLGDVTHSVAFRQVMKMLGNWEGKLHQPDGSIVETSTSFRLTSNGNTVVETLVEDGVEMITTYSDKDGELVVKHYCALGTEPMFSVGGMTAASLNLVSDSSPGYKPEHHNFVESLRYTLDENSPMKFRVDGKIYLDGELTEQFSEFERVN